MMRRTGFVTILLVLFLAVPVFAADNESSSAGGMMGGGMMGQGMMGHSRMSMDRMKEHHEMMRDMMGMFREMMVIMEGTTGVKDKQRAELKDMVKRMDEIMEKHRGMMKEMK